MLSIVIPTLQAEATLRATLETCVQAPSPRDIIVVDGGSVDDSRGIALSYGARIVTTSPGRGTQLAEGAKAATGDWLLFLHADTRLGEGWQDCVRAFMKEPTNRQKVGVFRFCLNDPTPAARRIEVLANWRTIRLGLPYGDQGLLISHSLYHSIGGFHSVPLMEDVSFVRRVGKKNLVVLKADAITSATRYQRGGYWIRPLRNLFLLMLFLLGVPPHVLAKMYD
ncbi:MAG: glycosyltransferase [Rhodospirillales bacterium]|nr:glycosyltransferase [Rhodospirillales bacterium]